MQIIQDFFLFIRLCIINPILRQWHYYINGIYIPDNARNQEILSYLLDVIENPELEAPTPTTFFFENMLRNEFLKIYAVVEFPVPIEQAWIDQRVRFYYDLVIDMLSYKWIKEE